LRGEGKDSDKIMNSIICRVCPLREWALSL
jgi:hypothetical protein